MSLLAISHFLRELACNNNRDWFNAHKEEYLKIKKEHEEFVDGLIAGISSFDKEVSHLSAKDCIYRIYRDVRFSYDKSPYKNYIGAYIVGKGGKKGMYAGYYLHIEPDKCMISGGLYCPSTADLKKIRNFIYENYNEFLEIIEKPDFKDTYGDIITLDSLKKMPVGFPADFKGANYFKYKQFLAECTFPDSELDNPDFRDYVLSRFAALKEFNYFLNTALEE